MSKGVEPIKFRSVFRVLGYVFLGLLLVFGGLHLFIYYKANTLLKAFVEQVSDGNYTAQSKSVRFAYLPFRIKAYGLHFYPMDTTEAESLYDIKADTLQLKLTSLIPLLFYNSLEVKEVRLVKPMVLVRSDAGGSFKGKARFNIPIKEIQDGLLKSLDLLQVDKCVILDGGFKLMREDIGKDLAINHIDLTIDSLLAAKSGMLSVNGDTVGAHIILKVTRPDIVIPDTNYLVAVDRLLVDTRKNVFDIDELRFSRNKKEDAYDTIKLSSISLRGLNWNDFLNEGIVELDSVMVKNGLAQIDLTDRFIFQKRSQEEKRKQQELANIPLIIHYANVQEVSYKLRSRRRDGSFTILLDGDSLLVRELRLLDTAKQPLKLGALSLNVRNYTDQDDKKTYLAGFDKLTIRNDDLNIFNYRIIPIRRKGFSANNLVNVPSLKLYDYDLPALLQGRLFASKLEVNKPTIVIDILGKKQVVRDSLNRMKPFFEALNRLKPTLNIGQLEVEQAKVILQPQNNATDTIIISELSTKINVDKLLSSNSLEDLMMVTEGVSSDGFFITGNRFNFKISGAQVSPLNNFLGMNRLQGSLESGLVLDLDHVQVIGKPGELMIPVDGKLNLNRVSVASGLVMVTAGQTLADGNVKKKAPVLNIDSLNAGNLSLTYIDKKGAASTTARLALDVNGLVVDNDNVSWIDALVEGAQLSTGAGSSNINAGLWYGSFPGTFTIEDVKIWPNARTILGATVQLPKVEMRNRIHSFDLQKSSFEEIVVHQPVLRWTLGTDTAKKVTSNQLPRFFVPKLSILNPDIDGYRLTKDGKKRHTIVSDGKIQISDLDLFYSDPELLMVNQLSFHLNNPKVEITDAWTARPASVRFKGSQIRWKRGELPSGFADSATVEGIGHIPVFKDSMHKVEVGVAGVSKWHFPSPTDSFIFKLVNGPDWWVGGTHYTYKGKNHNLKVYNASATRANRTIRFDSLLFKPDLPRDSFFRFWPMQKDFISVKLGPSVVHNFMPLQSDLSGVSIQRMEINEMQLEAIRDKRMPEDTVSYRPLLAGQIQQLPIDLNIDSLMVKNSSVVYREISPKSGLEGYLTLSGIAGGMYNVHSRPVSTSDSLLIKLDGTLFNAAPIHLRYAQPYFDSLQAFRFGVQFGEWKLSAANSLLAPLNSIVFKRGNSDSMWIEAIGDNNYAYGWIGHRYNRLNIGLLKDGYKRSYFMSGPTNFMANLIMVNNNKGGPTPFFTYRLENKATFNYWGRILREGMMGNMGMPGKKKNARKAMRKEGLPAQRPVP